MKRLSSIFSIYFAVGLMFLGFVVQTEAQVRRNEREVREIVRSLSAKVEDFQYGLTYQLSNNSADDQVIDNVTDDLKNLQKKIRAFSDNLNQRRENADDVSEILNAAKSVDGFLTNNQQNRRIETDWTNVRNLLDRLAANYSVSWDSNAGNSNFPSKNDDNFPTTNYPSSTNNYGLTGTYELDVSRSENTNEILNNSDVRGTDEREDLQQKLDAPEQIAVDIRGNQVTLASSKAAPVTFMADGQTRTETTDGKTIRLRASVSGQILTVSSLGGDNDYTITFASEDSGKTLKVTRRITTDYLNQTIFADSFYNKTDAVAKLGINNGNLPDDNGNYSSNEPDDRVNNGSPTVSNGRRGDYIVQNGTIISGTLNNEISTKVSQNNDRFKMTVQSPDQYRGAVIEGYISGVNRSGKVSGRSQINLSFERITLRNGQTYDFAGFLQSVTDANGKVVKVDTEGAAKGDSQTKETVKRGGIGAGLGAIIGAIAGGGKGAAIGAIIGGSAGAGSVVVQGKDDLELKQGSTITVQSSSPLR